MGFFEILLYATILVVGLLIGVGVGTIIFAGYTKLTDKIRSKHAGAMFIFDIIFIVTVCILGITCMLYFIQ